MVFTSGQYSIRTGGLANPCRKNPSCATCTHFAIQEAWNQLYSRSNWRARSFARIRVQHTPQAAQPLSLVATTEPHTVANGRASNLRDGPGALEKSQNMRPSLVTTAALIAAAITPLTET
jgi:hypothetical protein